ncbi:hypothetical protein [Streptomyces griseorubiginosus]|uniref:Uncharacterized protein n=1 Tax=Streptomyces griseorubiginosus TaxID=67304 RepID=A0A101RMN1_9ACTN|nr:hypothetical protein [Streptomyces griseorubiginosus]KUN58193.1 hypothetical protein AQJ54_42695 [Streptomyces griseorubiginosus]
MGTNLVSGLIGFLVGVPFALIFVPHLAARQAQTMGRAAALRQAPVLVSQFRDTLLGGFPSDTSGGARERLKVLLTASKALSFAAKPQPGEIRGPGSSHLADQIDEVNRALEQAFVVKARNSQQKVWFAELRAYWRQLETVLGPHLYDVGLRPEQPVQIEAALTKLTADRDTPFLRMTGGSSVPPAQLRMLASAMINSVGALLYLLDQLDDLERIGRASAS